MPIKPPTPRHTVQQSENGTKVTIPSKKNFFQLVWLSFWLLVSGYLGVNVVFVWLVLIGGYTGLLGNTSSSSGSNFALLIPIICFFLWLLAGLGFYVTAIYSFLWHIVGKEIIEMSASTMTLVRQILWWKKPREYSIVLVSNLKVNQKQLNSFAPIRSIQRIFGQDGMIAFDYEARTFHFGLEIDAAEAKEIISIIRQYFPQLQAG